MEAAAKIEPWTPPRLEHNFDRLAKSDTAFVGRNVEGAELARIKAATGTPIDATTGKDVEQRDFLGQAHWMIQRCECDRGADAESGRARGGIRAHHRDRGADAVVVEVM